MLSGPLRTCPAQNASDGPGAAPVVAPFQPCAGCYDFNPASNPAAAGLQRAFALYAAFVVEAFLDRNITLVGVNLAAEINLAAGRACGAEWFPAVTQFYNGVYRVIKSVLAQRGASGVPVFPSIQLETLMGVQAGQPCAGLLSGAAPPAALQKCISDGLAQVAALERDAFGVSTYPPMTSGAPAPAWYVPAVLDRLSAKDRASFVVAETGWNRVPIVVNLANGSVGTAGDPPLQCQLVINSTIALANGWLATLTDLARQEQWALVTWWSDTDLLYADSLPSCPCAVPAAFAPSCTFITAFRELEELAGGSAADGELVAKAFGSMGLRGLDGAKTALWDTLQAARAAGAAGGAK